MLFQLLGYTALFASRTKSRSSELEAKRRQERKEVYYGRLYKRHSGGRRGTSKCCMVKYKKICSDVYFACSWEEENLSLGDLFFGLKAAREACKKF